MSHNTESETTPEPKLNINFQSNVNTINYALGNKGTIIGVIRSLNSTEHNQIITPFRYSMVEEGVFRGAYPTPRNFRFLKRLKLKTIMSLTPQTPNPELLKFCQTQKITSKHYPVPKFKEDDAQVTLDPSTVALLLHEIINTKNHPIYIHCSDGAHTTGLLIMCLRKLQNWTLSIIFNEFTRYTRDAIINSTESEFVENFRAQVQIPLSIPKWLWQGERITKHPTVKIKLETDKIQGETSFKEKKTERAQALLSHEPNGESQKVTTETLSRNLMALALDGTF